MRNIACTFNVDGVPTKVCLRKLPRQRRFQAIIDRNTTPGSSADTKPVLNEVVFVLQKDGTIKMVHVKTGVQDDAWIQITSGLSVGDQVISAPYTAISRTLENGKKVKVVPKSELFEGPAK